MAAVAALKKDLYAIKDQVARKRGAIKILEELGYEVHLERRKGPRPKPTGPSLKLIPPIDTRRG